MISSTSRIAGLLAAFVLAAAPASAFIQGSGDATWHDFRQNINAFAADPNTFAYQSIVQCGWGLPGLGRVEQLGQVPAGDFNNDCYACVKVEANGQTAYIRAAGTASRLEVGADAKAILSPNADTFTASWTQVDDSECRSQGIDPWDRQTCPKIADGIYKPLYITSAGGYCS